METVQAGPLKPDTWRHRKRQRRAHGVAGACSRRGRAGWRAHLAAIWRASGAEARMDALMDSSSIQYGTACRAWAGSRAGVVSVSATPGAQVQHQVHVRNPCITPGLLSQHSGPNQHSLQPPGFNACLHHVWEQHRGAVDELAGLVHLSRRKGSRQGGDEGRGGRHAHTARVHSAR